MNNSPPLVTKIDTVLLRVENLETATAWYTQVLKLEPIYMDMEERLVVLGTGTDTSLTLHEQKVDRDKGIQTMARCYPIFYAPDIEATYEHLRGNGVEVEPISGEEGGTRWFAFRDCDGKYLEVCHYKTAL